MHDDKSHDSRRDHYTHGYAEPVIRAHAARTVQNSAEYVLPYLHLGMTVLDLGCGPGTITTGLAELVTPGTVIAADIDPGILARAAEYAASQGVATIDFRLTSGYDLDLDDDSVDLAHAHQVLQHVSDPVAVLCELRRVVRPGGIIAIRESDYGAFTWHPASEGLERWLELYVRAARANDGEPYAGRHLLAWAHQAGLSDVQATSSTKTYVAGESARWWAGVWAERIRASAVATQLLESGWASEADLDEISQAWLRWGDDPDAWFMLPGGEIVATV